MHQDPEFCLRVIAQGGSERAGNSTQAAHGPVIQTNFERRPPGFDGNASSSCLVFGDHFLSESNTRGSGGRLRTAQDVFNDVTHPLCDFFNRHFLDGGASPLAH